MSDIVKCERTGFVYINSDGLFLKIYDVKGEKKAFIFCDLNNATLFQNRDFKNIKFDFKDKNPKDLIVAAIPANQKTVTTLTTLIIHNN